MSSPFSRPEPPNGAGVPAPAPHETPAAPAAATGLSVAEAARAARRVLDTVGRAVVGHAEPLRLVLAGILSGGHVLLEDFPGLGKTLAARSFAQALGLDFRRVQFTPDLLPSDVTGSYVFDQRTAEFVFRPGPVFTGLLLADEINRTPPKTQAALLEAMQEGQVSVEGSTHPLPQPFHVLATANPIEYEGTYPLPEAQLDRFAMRISFGYPDAAQEWDILSRRIERRTEAQQLPAVLDPAGLLALQSCVESVVVEPSVGRYCVSIAAATRRHPQLLVGASPRGSLTLMTVGRALALIEGRDYLIPEDVKRIARAVLAHRITVKPELWLHRVSPESIVDEILAAAPVPSDDRAPAPS